MIFHDGNKSTQTLGGTPLSPHLKTNINSPHPFFITLIKSTKTTCYHGKITEQIILGGCNVISKPKSVPI